MIIIIVWRCSCGISQVSVLGEGGWRVISHKMPAHMQLLWWSHRNCNFGCIPSGSHCLPIYQWWVAIVKYLGLIWRWGSQQVSVIIRGTQFNCSYYLPPPPPPPNTPPPSQLNETCWVQLPFFPIPMLSALTQSCFIRMEIGLQQTSIVVITVLLAEYCTRGVTLWGDAAARDA